jgi:hypothetical protein
MARTTVIRNNMSLPHCQDLTDPEIVSLAAAIVEARSEIDRGGMYYQFVYTPPQLISTCGGDTADFTELEYLELIQAAHLLALGQIVHAMLERTLETRPSLKNLAIADTIIRSGLIHNDILVKISDSLYNTINNYAQYVLHQALPQPPRVEHHQREW